MGVDMSVLKLFNIVNEKAVECKSSQVLKERSIQSFIEQNLEVLFNIRFIHSEYQFIANDGRQGRMDTLGLDENNCPVIIEYKRSSNDNVINQGLFYMDWLRSHKKDFEWLILEKFNKELADKIDWSQARLICIAQDFNRYDEFAIRQLPINIDLVRYYFYDNQILFEFINQSSAQKSEQKDFLFKEEQENTARQEKSAAEKLEYSNDNVKAVYEEFDKFILSLNENIQRNELIYYYAYKNIKNIACIEFFKNCMKIYLPLEPQKYLKAYPAMRDVSKIGHRATGNLEITVSNLEELESIKDLIETTYQIN